MISKVETNSESGDCADRIYPVEPEVKDTIETAKYASHRGLLDIDTQELIWFSIYLTRFADNQWLRVDFLG